MNAKRVSLGYDLRANPYLQKDNPLQVNQRLIQRMRSPITADPAVWNAPEEMERIWQGILPPFANPLHLAKEIDLLIQECARRSIQTADLWSLSITSYETNLTALTSKYGPGYFDNPLGEEELLAAGWQFMGFDIVELDGLMSGLKGCGYVEPTWSKLRDDFGASLNKHGLFSEAADASQFAEVRGLEIRDHNPFTVVGVLINEPVS